MSTFPFLYSFSYFINSVVWKYLSVFLFTIRCIAISYSHVVAAFLILYLSSSDDILDCDEAIVFEAVARWLDHEQQQPVRYFYTIPLYLYMIKRLFLHARYL